MKSITVLVLLLAVCRPAPAGEEELERARVLRAQASEDWNAGEHDEAAEKLFEADRIYESEEADHFADRAVTLRALCWNLKASGLAEDARAEWTKLAHMVSGREAQWQDLWDAYVAVKECSRAFSDLDEAVAYLMPVRKVALDQVYPKVAAQVLHDLAYHASDVGDDKRAVALLEKAVPERRKIRDLAGLTWSLNNLSNSLVRLGKIEKALAPIREARNLVHKRGQLMAQRSVEQRVLDVLAALEESGENTKKIKAWIWEMGGQAASSPEAQFVPPDRILRAGISLDPDGRRMEKLTKLELAGRPPEVRADLLLRVVRADLGHRKALRRLDAVECGDGPASPHLRARFATVRALVLAEKGKEKEFPEQATAAAAAWVDLGDREGRQAALADILAAATALGVEAEMADLAAEYEELARSGRPGGAGGSASASGGPRRVNELGFADPLFRISMVDGKIQIKDLLTDRTSIQKIRWKPRGVGLNGLSLKVFGGYVVVENLSYGGGASASGTPGSIRLDDLGSYLPVPGKGSIVITKTGASRYE